MAETLTTHYGWTKPDPGASANTWGNTLNATTDKIDSQVYTNQLAGMPIGSGAMWFTATPPSGWLICDGSSLTTNAPYDKLFAVLGTQFNHVGDPPGYFRLPPMVNVFPYGGSLGTTGGAATVTLDATMIPSHAHPIVDVAHNHSVNQWYHDHGYSQTPHAHNGTQDPHNHTYIRNDTGHVGLGNGGSFTGSFSDTTSSAQPAVHVDAQYANINFVGATSSISLVASGTGLSTTQNAGGGAAHSNMPPYFGVNFIIKFS